MATNSKKSEVGRARQLVKDILYPERGFIRVAIVYGIAISLLTLAIPIAVQTLINTVVNIASVRAVITLAGILFLTLALSGLFSALRTYTMEKYQRHIYARLTAEISARTLMTHHEFFEGRRNVDITNRYFDINTFQKNLPPLLVDGFALVLQLIVGFTLVSFYHPAFLAFSLLLILCLYLIWVFWASSATQTAVDLSHAKYATAKWLGDIAAAHSFFKSGRHLKYAREKTDKTTHEYISHHRAHFRHTFSQTIALLLVYAVASSALLGVGGTLVIRGELSIGQLVAAELILTAIFFGLSKAGGYLTMYYELCGAADELGLILDVPLNNDVHSTFIDEPSNSHLQFHNVSLSNLGVNYFLDFSIASGAKAYVTTTDAWLQRAVINLLKQHQKPEQGWIHLADNDLSEYKHQHLLYAPVTVINKSLIIECTLLEFMKMSAPDSSLKNIHDILDEVGLGERLLQLKDGINTQLSPLGSPLQPHEFLLLKLAAAMLSKPKIIVLTQYFDNLPKEELHKLLKMLHKKPFTLLYFTNHPELEVFDYCFCLDSVRKN